MARPFIPAPNTALVEMVYTYAGQVIENTFHVQKSTPFTAGDLSILANAFDGWDSTGALKWSTLRNQNCFLQQIKTKALDTIASPVFIFVLPVARPGLTAGSLLPGNLTFCITLQTGLAGRSQRGRIFFPGLASGQIQGAGAQNLMNTAVANNMVLLVNNLIAAIAALSASHKLVVTSFRINGAWRLVAQNTVVTNAAYANLTVDTQRRRLP
jgi:hypothetical protein